MTADQQLAASLQRTIPAAWRAAIPVQLVAIDGATSFAVGGQIKISSFHRSRGDAFLDNVVAHEFGHLIAFRFGSQAYNGAGPVGWPPTATAPAEGWAKCVAKVFTGMDDTSYGLPPCSGESLSFAQAWLAAGPPA